MMMMLLMGLMTMMALSGDGDQDVVGTDIVNVVPLFRDMCVMVPNKHRERKSVSPQASATLARCDLGKTLELTQGGDCLL